jgi:Peptidase_C39 like family
MSFIHPINRLGIHTLGALSVGFGSSLPVAAVPAPLSAAGPASFYSVRTLSASPTHLTTFSPEYASAVSAVPLAALRISEVQRAGDARTIRLSVGRYTQSDLRWADEPYRWIPSRLFGDVGCTLTAATNLLNYTYPETNGRLTPHMANVGSPLFRQAMRRTRLVDLSGNGVDRLDSFGRIRIDSARGDRLVERIRDSVLSGRPVVVGIAGGDNGTYPRHSLTAYGINSAGDVLVADPWLEDDNGNAQLTTLNEAIEIHGEAVYFDIALSGSRR